MVDGVVATDAQGVATWEARPEPELDLLRQLVQSAIGFDAERGDVVTIESLQFTLPPEAGALAEAGSGFLAANGARLIQIGVLAAVVLALIFFVLRPLAARRPVLEITELTGPREALAGQQRLDHPVGDILDLPAQTVTRIERLRDVISSRSEDSAAVLRSWIESPEPRKEAAGS
jgi:flagellar M-ring protein FliF